MEIPYTAKARPDTGLYNAKVGIWLFLASEVMLFGALFSSYILLRVGSAPGDWPHHLLNIPLGMTNTLVLIVSSVTVVMSWASLKLHQFNKYRMYQGITLLCALIFLGIKTVEYRDKFLHYEVIRNDGSVVDGHIDKHKTTKDVVVIEGVELKAGEKAWDHHDAHHTEISVPRSDIKKMENYGPWHNTYMAIYFTLTGLHGLHVLGGALVIGLIWGPGAKMWKTDPERYTNRIEVSGLFWHFVDLVWIFLFPVLYLL
jgi:cytochrome c oxidase subunit III